MNEHGRLMLARHNVERRLIGWKIVETARSGRRVLNRAPVSSGMVAERPDVTPLAALRIIEEPQLRDMTGRGENSRKGIV